MFNLFPGKNSGLNDQAVPGKPICIFPAPSGQLRCLSLGAKRPIRIPGSDLRGRRRSRPGTGQQFPPSPIGPASELPAIVASVHHRTSDSQTTPLTCTQPTERRGGAFPCYFNHFLNSSPSRRTPLHDLIKVSVPSSPLAFVPTLRPEGNSGRLPFKVLWRK
jgi:hypothetical protein